MKNLVEDGGIATIGSAGAAKGSTVTSPCQIIIFGGSGDLTRRKLVPALYDLYGEGRLPQKFSIVGISRRDMSDDAYRANLLAFGKRYERGRWGEFARHIHYHAADATQSDAYRDLLQRLSDLAGEHGTEDNRVFYLSMAPHLYEPTINQIGAHGLVTEGRRWCTLNEADRPYQRIVIEKPFGSDPESADHLNRVVSQVFDEENVYRIDHYLGKETVQNLLVFRFANTIFEPIWSRQQIDHVQVTAAETVGVEGRGGYYDSPGGGAMRDMIQSHLLQVMSLVAMEPPISMRADDIRVEKTKILAACRTPTEAEIPDIAVRGQYGPGVVDGHEVCGYREEKGTDSQSQTDTYAALQVYVDTWRWGGVPFYLRSGKRMARKSTEIVITFRETPHGLFDGVFAEPAGQRRRNELVINVQPDEGIRLRFEGKVPGTEMRIDPVVMDFDYCAQFGADPPDAYATLLCDVIEGDQTLFKHREEVAHCWRIVQPVLDYWQAHPQDDLPNYAAGTRGPSAADEMLKRAGGTWHEF